VALTTVRAWRGRLRAVIKDAQGDLQSLLNYNAKHPTYGFLTPSESAQVATVESILAAKLTATRLR
jgi:hypothetical protein